MFGKKTITLSERKRDLFLSCQSMSSHFGKFVNPGNNAFAVGQETCKWLASNFQSVPAIAALSFELSEPTLSHPNTSAVIVTDWTQA